MLLVVLSAIGTLGVGAAVVGAYTGAHEVHRLREGAEQEREDKERDGLLRLVSIDIALHKALGLEDHLHRHPDECIHDTELKCDPGRPLRTDAWEQVRTTLAPLLPADRFASLTEYYSNVRLVAQRASG